MTWESEYEDLPPGRAIEVEPGVTVERRGLLLGLFAAGMGAHALAAPALGRRPCTPRFPGGADVDLDQLVREFKPLARELLDPEDYVEDPYLYSLAAYAVRLADVPEPEMRPSGQGEGTFIGANYGPDPFIVLHWRMEPGSRIRTHAHSYGNVVTLGLEGAARVRNYEMVGERDFDTEEPFHVRMTQDQLLLPGRINTVPLGHGYAHGFEAGPEGARGIDITTRRKDRRPTPWLELSSEPVDEWGRVYEGRWETD